MYFSIIQTLNENYILCLYFIQVPRVYISFFCLNIYYENISDDDDQLVLISYNQNQDKAWNCNVFQMWFFHFIYFNLIYVLLSKTVILLLCINICVCCDSQQMTIDRKQLKLSLVNNRNGYCIAFKLRQQLEYRGMSRMQYVMNQIWADECESTILVCFIYHLSHYLHKLRGSVFGNNQSMLLLSVLWSDCTELWVRFSHTPPLHCFINNQKN